MNKGRVRHRILTGNNGGMNRENSVPNIEVGCGVASGDDSYAVGWEAAKQAVASTASHPLSAVIIFA